MSKYNKRSLAPKFEETTYQKLVFPTHNVNTQHFADMDALANMVDEGSDPLDILISLEEEAA